MNAKHTPGPWHVERRYSNGCEIVPRITCKPDDDRGCGWIADVIGAPYLGHESTLPNARLIAAAPTLLAACREALEEVQTEGPCWCGSLEGEPAEVPCMACRLRAALAQAGITETPKEPT